MGVGLDDPRKHAGTPEVDDFSVRITLGKHRITTAHGKDASVLDRDGLGSAARWAHRHYVRADENALCRSHILFVT